MVLCVTHSNDVFNTSLVIASLEKMGIKTIRFNTDELLNSALVTHKLVNGKMDVLLRINDKLYSYKNIKAVWFRKLWSPKILDTIDQAYQNNVASEIRSSLFSFFNLLEKNTFCINKISQELNVERDKFNQLYCAKKSELLIPDTIVTSNFDELLHFYNANNQTIIAKLQNALSFAIQNAQQFFPTTEINASNVQMLEDTIRICPMIFQTNIQKAFELRIVFINGKCLTAKINATQSIHGKTDWRNSEENATKWEKFELPPNQIEKLIKLMHSLNLIFGVIDMIVTPNNEFVFLEVNPSGEWGMLEKDLGLPISQTIANTIANKIALPTKKQIETVK